MNIPAIYHISSDNFCYPLDEDTLVIKIQTGYDVSSVELVWGDPFEAGLFGSDTGWDGEHLIMTFFAETDVYKIWQSEVKPKFKRCRYYFILHGADEKIYYVENGFSTEQQFKTYKGRRQDFFFPWMNPSDIIKPADWVNSTVWYQIFPDRFCSSGRNTGEKYSKWAAPDKKVRNSELYGGDLPGVTSRLDYLQQLGVGGIYFTPINESPSTHKYDTADYEKIDSGFGTNDDMKTLVAEAHKRGIRIMLDGVFNHCGLDFAPWRDVLEKGRDSEYFDWFMINTFPFTEGYGKARRGEYYSFAFVDVMPKLNTNNEKAADYIISVCKKWVTEYDIDALRLDVSDELSHAFNKRLRRELFAIKPDFYIVGEAWHNSLPWLRGDEFDAVMNYSLQENIESFWRNPSFTAADLAHGVYSCYNSYQFQTCNVMFDLLDSHDTARLITRCGGDVNAFYQELCMLFTLNGSVSIYYGTEVCLEGSHDPDCRRCMPWREIERGDYTDRIEEMKRLIEMRKSIPELRNGSLRFIESGNDRVIIYEKYSKNSTYRIVLNCSGKPYDIGEVDKCVYARCLSGTTLEAGGTLVAEVVK